MNSSMERLHEVLDTNLSLLKESGHNLHFEKGMFQGYNLVGFEEVSYALLMIIDPDECKISIPWPILGDRLRRLDYRKSFVKFVKMINKRYPEARIKEITASSLQQPGGVKFVEFMCGLSTFTLELELRKMLSPEENEELLPKPEPSVNFKDMDAKIKIMQSARLEAEVRLNEITDYHTEAVNVLQRLNCCSAALETRLQYAESKLKEDVLSLTLDDQVKTRLLDIQDIGVMDEWENKTNKQLIELERNCEKINKFRDILTAVCQKLKNMNMLRAVNRPCLDGDKLKLSHTIAQFAGSPVYNSRGEVRLATLFKAAAAAVHSLEPVEPVDPTLIGEAQAQVALIRTQLDKAQKLTISCDELKTDCRKIISELQPIIYAHIKQKPERSDMFKGLQPRPPLRLLTSAEILKNRSTQRQIKRGKKTERLLPEVKKVVCSVKKRCHFGSAKKFLKKQPLATPLRTGLTTIINLSGRTSRISAEVPKSTSRHFLRMFHASNLAEMSTLAAARHTRHSLRPSLASGSATKLTAYKARRSTQQTPMKPQLLEHVCHQQVLHNVIKPQHQQAAAQLSPVNSESSQAESVSEVVEEQRIIADQEQHHTTSRAPNRKSLEALVNRFLAIKKKMKPLDKM